VAANSLPPALTVLTNDNTGGDSITITAVSIPDNGGTAIIDADNLSITYTPAIAFNGVETFTYDIADTGTGVSTATVSITVGAIVTPLGSNDTFDYDESSSTTTGGNRALAIAIKDRGAGLALDNTTVAGTTGYTYSVVAMSTTLDDTLTPISAVSEADIVFGELLFSAIGSVSGSLVRKQTALNINDAIQGLSSALTETATTTSVTTGSFFVDPDGIVTLTLPDITNPVSGLVTTDGRFMVFPIETINKRGIMLLSRQTPAS